MANAGRREQGHISVQDIFNLACGALLLLSPWAIGFTSDMRAAWSAWAGGVVIAAMAVAALSQFAVWEDWVALIVGAAVALSPWVLQFATINYAAVAFAVLGVVVALSSISEIWARRYHLHLTAHS